MAFSSNSIDKEPRSFSIGPLRMEIQEYTAANTDTSGTVTAQHLQEVYACHISGELAAAGQTITDNEVALTFSDPGGDVDGHVILLGK